ncbi:hypothetical protein GCM10028805_18220 [Spirosoma harenae]
MSFLVVSVAIVALESIFIELESVVIVDEESVTVVDVSVVSVFVLEQAVAKANIERRKKADFAMSV